MSLPRIILSSRRTFETGDEDMGLKFPLGYAGPLPSQQTDHAAKRVKHEIRQRIHNQLRDLVQRSRQLELLVMLMRGGAYDSAIGSKLTEIAEKGRLAGFSFIPLIVGPKHWACHLDIRFLRREQPGHLITKPRDVYGGDLDNRLKVFLDALRMPCNANELPSGIAPGPDEEPFFCLLQDDSLITRFQVVSDMLLGDSGPDSLTDVRLLVDVAIEQMPGHWVHDE